jgi:hypothetical protein
MSQDQHYGLEQSDAGTPNAFHTICPQLILNSSGMLSLGRHPVLKTLVLLVAGDPGHASITLIRKMFLQAQLPELVTIMIDFKHLRPHAGHPQQAVFWPFPTCVDYGDLIFSPTIAQGLGALLIVFHSTYDVLLPNINQFLQLFGKAEKVIRLRHGEGKRLFPVLS